MIKKNGSGWVLDWKTIKIVFAVVGIVVGFFGQFYAITNSINSSISEIKIDMIKNIGEIKMLVQHNELRIKSNDRACKKNEASINKLDEDFHDHKENAH